METPRMVSPVSHVINVQKVLHVPMKCWMQLLTANKFILFYWGRGVPAMVCRSPLTIAWCGKTRHGGGTSSPLIRRSPEWWRSISAA